MGDFEIMGVVDEVHGRVRRLLLVDLAPENMWKN